MIQENLYPKPQKIANYITADIYKHKMINIIQILENVYIIT